MRLWGRVSECVCVRGYSSREWKPTSTVGLADECCSLQSLTYWPFCGTHTPINTGKNLTTLRLSSSPNHSRTRAPLHHGRSRPKRRQRHHPFGRGEPWVAVRGEGHVAHPPVVRRQSSIWPTAVSRVLCFSFVFAICALLLTILNILLLLLLLLLVLFVFVVVVRPGTWGRRL